MMQNDLEKKESHGCPRDVSSETLQVSLDKFEIVSWCPKNSAANPSMGNQSEGLPTK